MRSFQIQLLSGATFIAYKVVKSTASDNPNYKVPDELGHQSECARLAAQYCSRLHLACSEGCVPQ